MSVWDRVKYWLGQQGASETYDLTQDYDIISIGNIVIPEKLTDKNAFTLANSVAEMFFPVDFYADRISRLRFFIANKAGKEIVGSGLNRLISNDINPLFTFSDLVYQYVFSLLGDGNAINYLGVPSVYQSVNPSTIERWDVLMPNLVQVDEYNNLSSLNVRSWSEIIRRARYEEPGVHNRDLDVSKLFIHNYSSKRRADSKVLAKSPLWGANKSIDTLLSVYSARYNVYANNGAAGYLAKKALKDASYEEKVLTGDQRDKILADLIS